MIDSNKRDFEHAYQYLQVVERPLATDKTAMSRGIQSISDYLSLLKPRVVLLHLLTATAAMFLAARGLPQVRALWLVLLGGGLTAGAANTLNCYFDRKLDKTMPRTQDRPLPAGRLSPNQALIFGILCATLGLLLLLRLSLTASALAMGALIFYSLVYTLWLKRSSTLSAVLSSGIGAVPTLIGWIAVTGHLTATPFLLFAIIALWTPPHFWALALARGDEYKNAGLSVLPRNKPAVWIIAFILLLFSIAMFLIHEVPLGISYVIFSVPTGLVYLILAFRLQIKGNTSAAWHLYVYSIFYLVMLFAGMIISLSI